MRGVKRYIARNKAWIVVGAVLTGFFVEMAYTERGYFAYGGEWLTLPLILLAVKMAGNVKEAVRHLFEMEDDYEPGRD